MGPWAMRLDRVLLYRYLERGAIFQSELKKTVAAVQVELGADVGPVGFNGPRADE